MRSPSRFAVDSSRSSIDWAIAHFNCHPFLLGLRKGLPVHLTDYADLTHLGPFDAVDSSGTRKAEQAYRIIDTSSIRQLHIAVTPIALYTELQENPNAGAAKPFLWKLDDAMPIRPFIFEDGSHEAINFEVHIDKDTNLPLRGYVYPCAITTQQSHLAKASWYVDPEGERKIAKSAEASDVPLLSYLAGRDLSEKTLTAIPHHALHVMHDVAALLAGLYFTSQHPDIALMVSKKRNGNETVDTYENCHGKERWRARVTSGLRTWSHHYNTSLIANEIHGRTPYSPEITREVVRAYRSGMHDTIQSFSRRLDTEIRKEAEEKLRVA
jgi:hypothetical protein